MYGNASAAAEYAAILAELETRETVHGIIKAGCYGLSVDEGTDISVYKILAMSVRFICVDTGLVLNRNLGFCGACGWNVGRGVLRNSDQAGSDGFEWHSACRL